MQANQAQGSEEQVPSADATLKTNYNAIELITAESPDQIFATYLQTFAGLQLSKNKNDDVATVPDGTNITGLCQRLTFTLQSLVSSKPLVWIGLGQGPFSVGVTQFNPQADTISIVTLNGHPLAGWRYWRAFSVGADDVVIETGAADTNAPGPLNYSGYYVLKGQQTKIWKEDLQYTLSDLSKQNLAKQGTNPNYNIVNGVWGYDQTYIMSHIVPHLPVSCGN